MVGIFNRDKTSLKHVFAIFSFIFVVWAIYRYFPEQPAWVSELVLKPIVWLLPTFWLVRKIEKKPLSSLGFNSKNLFLSLYWGIGLGIVFALEGLVTHVLKYRGLNLVTLEYSGLSFLGALGISFMTAISEETVFRGYIFNRLWQIEKNEWSANLVSSVLFTLIHLPIGVFVLSYAPGAMVAYLFFVFLYSVGSAFVFARTNNIISSTFLHVFWSWPIILFR